MIWDSKSLFSVVNGMLLVCLCACVVQFQVGQGGFGCSLLCFTDRPRDCEEYRNDFTNLRLYVRSRSVCRPNTSNFHF